MKLFDRVTVVFGRRLPLILQTEATECSLACLGMIAGYHGAPAELRELRARFSVSLKGSTLSDLARVADRMHLVARPLRLEMDDLAQVRLPCILHWNFNHFVVLAAVRGGTAVIHDPGEGVREISLDEVSRLFTGIAIEAWPANGFEKRSSRSSVKLRELVGRIDGVSRTLVHVGIVAVALEAFSLTSPFYFQWVIDNVLNTGNRDLLTTLALGFALLLLVQLFLGAMRSWMVMFASASLNLQWRGNVFRHLVRLPVQYFEKRQLGDVIARFNSIEQIQKTLTVTFVETVLDGLMAAVTMVIMFLYAPGLAGVVLASAALYSLARLMVAGRLRLASEEQIVHSARQQTHFLSTVRGVRTIKLFQRQGERTLSWLTLFVAQMNAELRAQKITIALKLISNALGGAESILVIWLGARLVLDSKMSAGALVAFNAYRLLFGSRTVSLIDKLNEAKMLELQGDRLADIVLTRTEPVGGDADSPTQGRPAPVIEIRDIHFRYADNEPPVLSGVSFRVEAGEAVAIVGPSGCGKSTLLNLLLGFGTPTQGDVLVDGVSLQQAGADHLRAIAGTVLQDDVLFSGSIADNISFFDPRMDMAWIRECAAMAAIAPDIERMPMGYNTLVGDMGTVLSGGQKQRILFARAIYKRPSVLLLDEATSHLDLECERRINDVVKTMNMTRVIVAHRPDTIASADRVVRLGGEAADKLAAAR